MYRLTALLFLVPGLAVMAPAQTTATTPAAPAAGRGLPPRLPITPIAPAKNPLPPENASAGVTRFSFIAYGDSRGPRDSLEINQAHAWVVESMLRTAASLANGPDPVRFVLQSGDAVLSGVYGNMLNVGFTPLISRLTSEGGLPYYFAVGNHDVTTTTTLTDSSRVRGLQNALAANANFIPRDGNVRRLNGYFTYAFGYGNTFVIAIDTQIAGDSTQVAWVRRQLEGLDRTRYVNVIVFGHSPAYTSGSHGGPTVEPQSQILRDLYMPLLRKHHVKLFLTGHDHVFDHFIERYVDNGVRYRLDQIVSGGGGAPIYKFTGEPDLKAYMAADSVHRLRVEHLLRPSTDTLLNPHHYLVVHVDGEQLTVQAIGVGWGTWWSPYPSMGLVLKP